MTFLCQAFLFGLSLLLYDGLYYWFHRFQHTNRVRWKFHRRHHSISSLNCLSSYNHPAEELFRIPLVTVPLALLITIKVPALAFLSSFFAVYGLFIHMNSGAYFRETGHLFSSKAATHFH